MFLEPEQLKQLTGKVRRPAQVRQLNSMGILYKLRADGMPIVLINHINKQFDGIVNQSKKKGSEPNWENM